VSSNRRLAILHIVKSRQHVPEVVIKVISQGSNSLAAIQAYLDDISKGKHRSLETEDGESIKGQTATKRLIEDWDLDLEELAARQPYIAPMRRKPHKLVHKLVFSMPRGTPAEKLLMAVRHFAQEQFTFCHRYALALHTDRPHPYVHVLVKAVSEECVRLNIRKSTLRDWRQAFVRHLRTHAIPAKATRSTRRPRTRKIKVTGMSRPLRRQALVHR
jgi:hypothetical protein